MILPFNRRNQIFQKSFRGVYVTIKKNTTTFFGGMKSDVEPHTIYICTVYLETNWMKGEKA